MSVADIISVLIPVFVVIGLGYLAGARKIFDADQVEGFNEFVLGFALPAMVFVGVVATPRSALLGDVALFIGVTAVQLLFMGLGLVLGRTVLRRDLASSAIIALMIAVPTAAFMGTPILDALFRKSSSSLAISLYAIAVNAVILPVAIVILEWGTRPTDEDQSFGTVLRRVLITTASRSIVWSPFLALALVLVGFDPPEPFDASLDLIGQATSAVALFASGLIIARFRVTFGVEPIALAIIKNVAQPAAMIGIAAVLGITGVAKSEAVILTAMPASVVGPMFAVRYGAYESESASALIASTVLSIATMVAAVLLFG
ncbi:MAG TPA: AEC family transporter [Actinomycetota bacterium]|nr:AEC family transporter [Actinomycetota bacterium]